MDGYYDNLLALFEKAMVLGFIEESAGRIVFSAGNAEELIRKMEVSMEEKGVGDTSRKRKRSS